MTELLRNRHFVIYRAPGSPMIEVRRTSEGFDTIEEMKRAFGEVATVLDDAGRISSTLLIDTRHAPPRNDPGFEAVFDPLRIAMLSGFKRVAVLVATTAGRLQVERHSRMDGLSARAFIDEDEARAYCMRSR